MTELISTSLIYGIPSLVVVLVIVYVLSLRRVVPTNVVHIVQRGGNTVSYGVKEKSNVYYEFPKWVPYFGVEVQKLPVSNFDIELTDYSAYDKDRVPFLVDVKSFFFIKDTNIAAQKVSSFEDLRDQLKNVVQGAVRSILAKSKLETIMEDRSSFGEAFTQAVSKDLASWGVETTKNIELMDIRDTNNSTVIKQIMDKRISAIDMESRTEVASNRKKAKQAELEAEKEILITEAETEKLSGEAKAKSEQAIGIAKAESIKNSGIAEQISLTEIAKAEQLTAEEKMKVVRVNEVKQAEINREKSIILAEERKAETQIEAEANKFKVETDATAELEAKKKEAQAIKAVGEAQAEVIKAKGLSEAESKKQMELANVTAQTTLASEIGDNEGYQEYLVNIRKVEVNGEVDKVKYESLATALNNADLKLLVNSGDVHSGLNKFTDILSPKGGSAINGLLETLKQTPEGANLLSMLNGLTQKNDVKS